MWFPGGDSDQALALARSIVPPEQLNHPGTSLEFGERVGRLFVLHQHLHGPPIAKPPEGPRIINPA